MTLIDGRKIEKLCQSRKWTVTKLAAEMGLSYNTVYRVMSGRRGGGSRFLIGLQRIGENPMDYVLQDPQEASA